jgi:hypothetical protein
MKLREDHLSGRHTLGRVHLGGDSTSVILDGHASLDVDSHRDAVTEPRERFIHGVVHDFEDEVVKASVRGIADVHTWAFPHGLEPLENTD